MTSKNRAQPLLQWISENNCEATPSRDHRRWRVTYHGKYVGTIPAITTDQHAMLNAKSLIRRNIRIIDQENT